mmetsp:Transcript_16405/g.24185  ORF Transcript_16405/g.24185 Transcript_16405/m.24185 type:complete len:508 (-) Transcript_16405:277-1800(-)|eukprot:CAMPEP_0194214242 /NCGR_PEP_ID=MMETSP0156-20130528/15411_1 /TAXON_ID=33649 /ORGANISM="Thalassionema nitzschioides, Strain L26-B" /LENGTH=507 /DNA_ID=CAMNT_0038942469 /DNA_START=55 /DNA_END=1578 /DNA_ORIENTATION=-
MAKNGYERGTPRGPISNSSRSAILCLIVFFSSLIVVSVAGGEPDVTSLSLAGAMASVVGLLYGSRAYGLVWNIIIFVSTYRNEIEKSQNILQSLLLATQSCLPLLILQMVVKLTPSRLKVSFAQFTNPVLLSALGAVFLISSGPVFLLLFLEYKVAPIALLSVFIGFTTILVLILWFRNRSHKFLTLLEREELGVSFLTTIALGASLNEGVLPALIASVITTLLCLSLCATADVWYSVSTGQFWMIALDTVVGGVFILLPATILVNRLNILYGTSIFDTLQSMAKGLNAEYNTSTIDWEMARIGLPLFLGLISIIGNTTIRALCPFAEHLYSIVYTHGQPNTKKIAFCIFDWSNTGKKILSTATASPETKVFFNFIVSNEELLKHASSLKEARAAGHTIIPYTKEQISHTTYNSLFSQTPEWSHGKSYPSDLIACSQRDTKIALWSHYYDSSDKPKVTDLEEMSGGAIVCLKQPVKSILELLEALTKKGYTVAPMSEVAKEDLPMQL